MSWNAQTIAANESFLFNPLTTNVSYHIETSQLIWFAMQINWLIFKWWGALVINGLNCLFNCFVSASGGDYDVTNMVWYFKVDISEKFGELR